MSTSPRVLLADDEPFYLEWLADYLESKGIAVEYATTVNEALEKIQRTQYRFLVVDLNIPLQGEPVTPPSNQPETYRAYPGLHIANSARNSGYRTKQVIVYSVFASKEIEEAVGRLYCTYITKGHPIDLKREVDEVLSYDPTADRNP